MSSLEDIISQRDTGRLFSLLQSAEPYEDVETPYYLVSGLQAIGFDKSNEDMRNSACTMAKAVEYTELSDIFYSTSIAAMINGCKVSLHIAVFVPITEPKHLIDLLLEQIR